MLLDLIGQTPGHLQLRLIEISFFSNNTIYILMKINIKLTFKCIGL